MTIKEIQSIAAAEMKRDGVLSKGVRLAILEKAKEGETFEIEVSLFDADRMASELRRQKQGYRISRRQIQRGALYHLTINKTK